MINTSLNETLNITTEYLPIISNKYVIAFAILLIGIIAGRLVGYFLKKLLHELHINKFLTQKFNREFVLEETLSGFFSFIIYFIAIILALQKLKLIGNVVLIVSVGFLIIFIISAMLSVRDFVINVTAGMLIRRKRLIRKKEHIKVANVEGFVLKVDLLDTILRGKHDEIIRIPNSTIISTSVIKFTNNKTGVKERKNKEKSKKSKNKSN